MARRNKQRKRAGGTGTLYQRSPGAPFTAEWMGADGKPKRKSTRTSDRAAAAEILAKWVSIEAKRREGLIDDRAEAIAAHSKRAVGEHLADYRAYLTAKRNTAAHVRGAVNAATVILDAAKVKSLADLSPSRVLSAVNELNGGKASARTRNRHLMATRSFVRWCIHDGRLAADPLAGVKGFNLAVDRRRKRRPLDDAELRALIAEAARGPVYRGLTGEDRAMLYRLAVGTGFRAMELASLTPGSFQLDGDNPAVVVAAAHSKHRREDRQPIRADLADVLRPWLACKPEGEPVFAGNMARSAEILRFDLRRARARWIKETPDRAERRKRASTAFLREMDDSGRCVDFHALRATFITSIVRSGASVKVAQTLARHSDPKLTLNTYTTLGVHDVRAGLDGLPTFDGDGVESEAAALRATGTDGRSGGGQSGSNRPTKHVAVLHDRALRLSHGRADDERENPLKTRGNRSSSRGPAKQCVNSPGWIRTNDPKIMSPLL